MPSSIDRYKADIAKLVAIAKRMYLDLSLRHAANTGKLSKEDKACAEKLENHFEKNYQKWFSESYVLIKQLLPDRLQEFDFLYKGDGKRKGIRSDTYNIQDWLNGIRAGENWQDEKYYDDFGIVFMRFNTQVQILESIQSRFESSLFDIKQLVQADLLDGEIESARELLKCGFLRASGAVCGVVMEKHLRTVCQNHSVVLKGKHPTISDFNDNLKKSGVIDVPLWRQIQRLGDLRNLCDHNKYKEPSNDEVEELISGTEKLTKTLF